MKGLKCLMVLLRYLSTMKTKMQKLQVYSDFDVDNTALATFIVKSWDLRICKILCRPKWHKIGFTACENYIAYKILWQMTIFGFDGKAASKYFGACNVSVMSALIRNSLDWHRRGQRWSDGRQLNNVNKVIALEFSQESEFPVKHEELTTCHWRSLLISEFL